MFDNKEHYLWTEKYRPNVLDEFVGNDQIKEKIAGYLQSGDIPHLLFFGGAGTGKTSISKLITKTVDCDLLYINASDENSVDTVRNKIKTFASTIGFKDLKVIILDESDFITPNGQGALRNIMETFSRSTRFILTCNYIEKIIEPIQSRCQTFNIIPPSKKDIAIHVSKILEKENIEFDLKDLATVINVSYPDIRKVINTCQQNSFDGKLVLDKQSMIESNYMLKALEILKSGIESKQKIKDIRQLLADSQVKRFEDLYKFLFDSVDDFAKNRVADAILIIAEAQYQEVSVVDKEIAATAMLVKLIQEVCK